MGAIILTVIITVAALLTALNFIGQRLDRIADQYKKAAEKEVTDYKAKVEILKNELHPYMLYVNADNKLFYTDSNITCMVNGIVDFCELHPEQKGRIGLFLDKDPQTYNFLFIGPNRKSK